MTHKNISYRRVEKEERSLNMTPINAGLCSTEEFWNKKKRPLKGRLIR